MRIAILCNKLGYMCAFHATLHESGRFYGINIEKTENDPNDIFEQTVNRSP